MKYTKHLIIVSAMLILLSSCGSLSITQKRYSRGLNIDWFSGKDVETVAAKKSPKKKEIKTSVAQTETPASTDQTATDENVVEYNTVVANDITEPTETVAVAIPESTKETKKQQRKIERMVKVAEKLAVITPSKKSEAKVNHKESAQPNKAAEAGLITIVLVILALFIPPLAVLLKDMELSSAFWLNLLLCVLGAVLYSLFGVLGGLLFLIAVIHAILYILEMI